MSYREKLPWHFDGFSRELNEAMDQTTPEELRARLLEKYQVPEEQNPWASVRNEDFPEVTEQNQRDLPLIALVTSKPSAKPMGASGKRLSAIYEVRISPAHDWIVCLIGSDTGGAAYIGAVAGSPPYRVGRAVRDPKARFFRGGSIAVKPAK